MSSFERYSALPSQLQVAVRIWVGLGIVSLALPESISDTVGVLAQAWFWMILPLLALLPYRKALIGQPRVAAVRRVRRGGRALGRIHALGNA